MKLILNTVLGAPETLALEFEAQSAVNHLTVSTTLISGNSKLIY